MASVSQTTKFDAICRARGQRRRREGKYSISKCSFLLTAYISADCMFEFGFLKHVLFGVSVSALCN